MAKEKVEEREVTFKGCYGEQVVYGDLVQFLSDAFATNNIAEDAGQERFATCIWGHAGCVLADTEVEVRKITSNGKHKINIVNPVPE